MNETLPRLTDQQLNELAEFAQFCRSGCDASQYAPALISELRNLRRLRERITAAMNEIERLAREAEQAGTASAYCALWDAHGLVHDALTPGPPQDGPHSHASGLGDGAP